MPRMRRQGGFGKSSATSMWGVSKLRRTHVWDMTETTRPTDRITSAESKGSALIGSVSLFHSLLSDILAVWCNWVNNRASELSSCLRDKCQRWWRHGFP